MTYKLTKTSQDADPYYGAVSLLLSGDGANNSTDIRDSSRNTKVVTAVGDAKISTAQSKFGGASMYFDGNGDYLTSPVSTDYEFGTGDFTVECWVRFNSTSPQGLILLGRGAGGAGGGIFSGWSLVFVSNTLYWYRYTGTEVSVTVSWTPSINTWYHIAVSRESGTLRIFVDGTSLLSTANTTSYDRVNNDDLRIGIQESGAGTRYFNGYLQDLRITKGVARYTSNFTPPTQPFQAFIRPDQDPYFYATSLLLHGNGTNGSTTITDSSPTPKTVTAVGDAQISTAQSKFGGSSLYFDGQGDSLTGDRLTVNANLLGGSTWTAEAWIYVASLAGQGRTIFSQYNANDANRAVLRISTTGTIEIFNGSQGTAASPAIVTVNQWHHIAFVRSSTSIVTAFFNGAQACQATNFAGPTNVNTMIGAFTYPDGALDDRWYGWMDDIRITNGVARYTSNFTPPTHPFPNV